jgi:hypothetical protein
MAFVAVQQVRSRVGIESKRLPVDLDGKKLARLASNKVISYKQVSQPCPAARPAAARKSQQIS